MWCRIAFVVALSSTGCLDPLVDDEYVDAGHESLLLPPGTEVPSLHDDPDLDEQVDANDGVDRFVPLIGAFAAGEHVRYWEFGTSPTFIEPVWVIGTDDGSGGLTKLPDHPVLFDVVPGDASYTPIWQVYATFVTDSYAGELITSVPALQEAEEKGLIQTPVPMPMYVNCPVTHPEVLVEVGGGVDPVGPNECFYRGMRCYYFTFNPVLVTEGEIQEFPVQNHYVLRRQGGEPLSEPLRNVDMTGDGDLLDTNDVFEHGPQSASHTALVRRVQVAIPADAGSIDTYLDETQADYTDAAQLFTGSGEAIEPIPDVVVAYDVEEQILNRPQQVEEGGL